MLLDPRIPMPDSATPAPAAGAGWRDPRLHERITACLREAEALAESVLLHDGDGVVIGCNPAAERLLGAPEADLVASGTLTAGLDVFDRHGLPLAPRDLPAVRALASGETQETVLALRGGDGGVTWVDAVARPLFAGGADTPYAVRVSLRVASRPPASGAR